MSGWTQCPVGLDHPRPCGGAVRQVSPTRWECDRDATHAWTKDGVPAVTVETVAIVTRETTYD